MLQTIEKSERFVKEFNDWKSRVEKVENPRLKKEINELMTELLREVRELDSHHMDVLMSKQLPSIVADKRSRLTELRQTIHRLITSYEKTHQLG